LRRFFLCNSFILPNTLWWGCHLIILNHYSFGCCHPLNLMSVSLIFRQFLL
jgi:hypothetical protein